MDTQWLHTPWLLLLCLPSNLAGIRCLQSQINYPPSTFTSDIMPDRLHTSLSTSIDGKGRGIFEKRLWLGLQSVNFTRGLILSFRIELFLPGLLLLIHSHPDSDLFHGYTLDKRLKIKTVFFFSMEKNADKNFIFNNSLIDWNWLLTVSCVIVAVVSVNFPLAQTAHEWKIYFLNWKWFHLWPCRYHHGYETMICYSGTPCCCCVLTAWMLNPRRACGPIWSPSRPSLKRGERGDRLKCFTAAVAFDPSCSLETLVHGWCHPLFHWHEYFKEAFWKAVLGLD